MALRPEIEKPYSPGEVAALFRVNVRTVNRWTKEGKVPGAFRTLGGASQVRPFRDRRGVRGCHRAGREQAMTDYESFELTLIDLSDIIATAARAKLPKFESLSIVDGRSLYVVISFANIVDLKKWADWCSAGPVGTRDLHKGLAWEHRAEATVLGVKVHLQAHTARAVAS